MPSPALTWKGGRRYKHIEVAAAHRQLSLSPGTATSAHVPEIQGVKMPSRRGSGAAPATASVHPTPDGCQELSPLPPEPNYLWRTPNYLPLISLAKVLSKPRRTFLTLSVINLFTFSFIFFNIQPRAMNFPSVAALAASCCAITEF